MATEEKFEAPSVQEEPETLEEETSPETSMGELLSPGGIMMLIIAGILDFLLIICTILILVFGVGIILGKIVNGVGFITIGGWQLSRSGVISTKKETRKNGWGLLKKFFKKQWKKLGASLIHIPTYTWTVYSELKG